MSDEILSGDEIILGPTDVSELDYEQISSDEVDRVVDELEELMETVESENIRAALEDAMNAVFYLVYDVVDEADEDIDSLTDAA
jgi:hypothetical protein